MSGFASTKEIIMKKIFITAATLGLALSLPLTASAQGRHDEKPHASTKPTATSSQQARVAATGGRHDSGATTHGVKRPAAQKASTSSEDAGKAQQ